MRAAGAAAGSSETMLCVQRCSQASNRAGRLTRFPAGSSWRLAGQSYHTRASIGSYTRRSRVGRTIRGATTCLVPSRSVAGEGEKEVVLPPSSALRRPIAERPQGVADRRTPGHWEADLMLFSTYGHAVLIMHERHSRILIAVRPPGKASSPIASAMSQVLEQLPPQWRRTVTFDNGTEFARHHQLHALGIETFFCDTHAPWQKGGVENAIGRLRRTLPRKTDLAALSENQFTRLIRAYNNTPRKCLGYRTPAEIFQNQVLHLKCESTESRGGGWVPVSTGTTGRGAPTVTQEELRKGLNSEQVPEIRGLTTNLRLANIVCVTRIIRGKRWNRTGNNSQRGWSS